MMAGIIRGGAAIAAGLCALLAAPLQALPADQYLRVFSPILGQQAAAKAAPLLSAIDAAIKAIADGRAAAYKTLLDAEDTCRIAFALGMAREAGEPWTTFDGSLTSDAAWPAFFAARDRAAAVVAALSRGETSLDSKSAAAQALSLDSSVAKLAGIFTSAPLAEKTAQTLEKELARRCVGMEALFPEAVEAGTALMKAGAAGRALWFAALAQSRPYAAALALAEKREAAAHAAPEAARALEGLEFALSAYRDWIAAFPAALHPYEAYRPLFDADREPLSGRVAARDAGATSLGEAAGLLLALGIERGRALLAAMEGGDGRDRSAAASARRLSDVFLALDPSRRRMLSLSLGMELETLAAFADLAASSTRPSRAIPGAVEFRATSREARALELNHIAAELAGSAAVSATAARSGSPSPAPRIEAALVLLERPDLAALARAEPRYAKLNSELAARLTRILAAADAAARESLKRDPRIAKAAAAALGGPPAGFEVGSIYASHVGSVGKEMDIAEPGPVSFFALATAPDGRSMRIAVDAVKAAAAYAAGFAGAAGLDAKAAAAPDALLARYGLRVEASLPAPRGRSLLQSVPPDPGRLDSTRIETMLIEGWLP
jgi:hypothetical protein